MNYGRIPSPPDPRDFKLEPFLAATDPLQALLDNLLAAKGANVAVKAWAKEATARILGTTPPPPPPPQPSGKTSWDNPRPTLDQGNYGTCVGNGCAQWGNTSPINDSLVEKDARAIYYEATVLDGAPDDPDSPGGGQQGATVRSGVKALKNRKRLSVYASASSVDTAVAWIQAKGPVIFGTDFTYDMENPDATGLVHPTGGVAGGHCYIGTGYDPADEKIEFLNSWGAGWGVGGRFYMLLSEFKTLFADYGEAWTAVELPL